MTNNLSSDLRSWREKRGVSLGKLSLASGVSKATLSRWETGVHAPRPAELASVLDALGVASKERERCLRPYAPALIAPVRRASAPLPLAVGELLYALRLRSGKTQADAARSAGISQVKLSRFESGASLPTDAERHTLCFALGATAQEAATMITQPFAEKPLADNWESLLSDFYVFRVSRPSGDNELPTIAFAAQLGRLVRQGKAEKHHFLPIWAHQGEIAALRSPSSAAQERIAQRLRRVVATLCGDLPVMYVSALLQSFDTDGNAADRLHKMEGWTTRFTDPIARAYFLNGVVKVARTVDKARALRLMDEIADLIAGDRVEFPLRMQNRANHLLFMNEPEAALAVLEKHTALPDPHGWYAGVWELTRSRAFAATGDKTGAARAVAQARTALLPGGAAQYGATIACVERFASDAKAVRAVIPN